jgi:hypothetical protein
MGKWYPAWFIPMRPQVQILLLQPRGVVAQLGERGLCKPEVNGSIPFSSTKKQKERKKMSATTELLIGEIKVLETKLLEAHDRRDAIQVMALEGKLQELRKKLAKANEILTENRSVLKG